MYENFILSLDVSTTTVGYVVYDLNNKKIEVINFFKPQGDTMFKKVDSLEVFLKEVVTKYNIKTLIIEERLKSFRANGTNAQAMLGLAIFNFMCQYLLNVISKDIKITEINVKTARKLAYQQFYKIERLVKIDDKQLAFNLVIKELGDSLFPKKVMKAGPRKGQEVFIDEAQDMSDAYILIKAFVNSQDFK